MNLTGQPFEGTSQVLFGWTDYSLFLLMLVLSAFIGVYFGFWGKKSDTPEEYLLGGKSMATLPVAVSLVASLVSGITMLGEPAETYTYGTLYWLGAVFVPIMVIVNNYLYLPVFYELQLTSVYEYLQLRFNRSVRLMASVLCTVGVLLNTPIVIYAPALALSQVTGLNIHIITPVISIICIFYTMVGGIKAVVWTDFLQGMVMVVASLFVIILGLIHVGGFGVVWQRNLEGGRTKIFDMDPSPFERMNFWSASIGGTTTAIAYISVNQAVVQRFLSLPSLQRAKLSFIILGAGNFLIRCMNCFIGLMIFATYYGCDPMKTKVIARSDQLLAYYVVDISSSVPGLAGLFMAGIFSAALSTMSTSLNSLGATLFEDFVRPCLKTTISDKAVNNIIKLLVVIIGTMCVVMVFIVDRVGGLIQLSLSMYGVATGGIFGLFTFGMFYPRGNSKGALVGGIVSLLTMMWLVFGTQKALADGVLVHPKLYTSAAACGINDTLPDGLPTKMPKGQPFILYRITFLYYSLIGFVVMFVVGLVVSHVTEPPNIEEMNPNLFSPIIRKQVLQKRNKYELRVIEERSTLFSQHHE